MKQLFRFWVVAILLFITGCSKEYDDSALVGRVDDLENRVLKLEQLCQQMNTNISSLQTIVTALQNNDYITDVTPITENGNTVGYTITFTKAKSITIYHGKDGADGKDGKDGYTPQIGVKKDTDDIYYWTLYGEWLLDDAGNKVTAVGVDGKNGQDGANGSDGKDGQDGTDGTNGTDGEDGNDGITPQLKIENDYWYVSYDNRATWTQLGKATGENGAQGEQGVQGPQGVAGQNGDSFFESVTQDSNNVYFTLADGTLITVPKGLALRIVFDEADLVVMSPNSTRSIGYTVTSVTASVKVEVTSSADIKAKVVTDNENGLTGKIEIKTSETIDEYSKVIVFVSNGDKVIMHSITFEEAGLVVEENAIQQASSEGGELTLEFMSNVECKAVIPADDQSWISVVPATRALERQTITLKLEPNEGYYRSTIVTVQSSDGSLKLEYQVEQDGDLGVKIDPTAIPDNEIWYTTVNKMLIGNYSVYGEVVGGTPFDRTIIEHKYENGLGVIKFDGPVTAINDYALASVNFPGRQLKSVYLPDGIRKIGTMAFTLQENIEVFRVPESLEEINESFRGAKIGSFIGHHLFEDGKGIVIDGVLYTLNYDEEAEELVIPGDVVEIAPFLTGGFSDFSNRPNIKSLYISEGVTAIGNSAFQGCSRLETIHIPNSIDIDSFGTYVFRRCSNIRSFSGSSKWVSPDGKLLYDYMFIDGVPGPCVSDAAKVDLPIDYVIPEGILSIRPCAFENCLELRSITLPGSILLIESGGEIFRNCPNFEFIYGAYASDDNKCAIVHNKIWCDGNALLAFAGKNITSYTTYDVKWLGDQVFSGQSTLEEIIINDEVTNIGNYCFSYCPNLRSITLPASLKVVRYDPFIGSNSLETIYFRSPTPPKFEVGGIEQNQYPNLTIYVPEQYLQAYLNDANWSPLHKYMKGYQCDDLYYISTDYSLDGGVKTLQSATKGDGIDIVLMGDAYSDRQIADGTYEADMKNLYDNLFTEEPYKSFKDHFNVYYVNVVSATEGYEYGNTALDGYFGDGTLVGGNDNAVFNYALKAISAEEMDDALLIVAMNSNNYAGTCYMYYPETNADYGKGVSVSYFPKGGNTETFAQLLHHEACGHGFAKLADEYAYEDYGAVSSNYVSQIQSQQANWGWWKNVDFTNNLSAIRWKHFINDARYANDGLGAYEGSLTYWTGVWRPTENSIMRYNTGGFNAPSREAIYYRIHKLAYGDSWQYDYEEFVEWDAKNRTSAATRAMVYKPTNYKPTHPPVVISHSWKEGGKK